MKKLNTIIIIIFFINSSMALSKETMLESINNKFSEYTSIENEVITSVKNKHYFDWRKSSFELSLLYGYVDEANNFNSVLFGIGLAKSFANGILPKLFLKRINVSETQSSKLVSKTPFLQSALPTRYEIGGGVGFNLFEGRSMSRLSPYISDFDHVFYVFTGMYYSKPTKNIIPSSKNKPEALKGQQLVNSKYVAQIGLHWKLYFLNSLGVEFNWETNLPVSSLEHLKSWYSFSGGLVWSFGN